MGGLATLLQSPRARGIRPRWRPRTRAVRVPHSLQPGSFRVAIVGSSHRMEQRITCRVGVGQSNPAEWSGAHRTSRGACHGIRDSARALSRDWPRPGVARRCSHGRSSQRSPFRSPARPDGRVASLAVHSCGIRTFLSGSLMPERTVQIINKAGLHARPAAEIVKLAAKYASDITVVRDELEVNGKSIMGVMMLAAECGSTLQLKAEGPDALQALDALEKLIQGRFGES